MATVTQSFTVDDFDYLVHGGNALKMRLYRPAGTGPFQLLLIFTVALGTTAVWRVARIATKRLRKPDSPPLPLIFVMQGMGTPRHLSTSTM